MKVRRRPVKVWQVLAIAAVIGAVFLFFALKQNQYNVTETEKPFSQTALEQVEQIAGSKEDLYATGFTYNDSEDETFVVTLSAPGRNGRQQNWNLIFYQADGRMPYRMEKADEVLSLQAGAQKLDELFPRLERFREEKDEVFGLFKKEKEAQKGENSVQLDIRDRFGEDDLLLERETAMQTGTDSSEGETSSQSEDSQNQEKRVSLDEEVSGLVTVTVSESGVEKKAYQPGDCDENSFVLYRSARNDEVSTEKLLAIVNVEES